MRAADLFELLLGHDSVVVAESTADIGIQAARQAGAHKTPEAGLVDVGPTQQEHPLGQFRLRDPAALVHVQPAGSAANATDSAQCRFALPTQREDAWRREPQGGVSQGTEIWARWRGVCARLSCG